MNSRFCATLVALVFISLLSADSFADIEYVSQARSVSASGYAMSLVTSDSDSHDESYSAPDFGPFTWGATAEVGLASGTATYAYATLISTLSPLQITASGYCDTSAESVDDNEDTGGFSSARFSVTFDVTSFSGYSLTGDTYFGGSGSTSFVFSGPSGLIFSRYNSNPPFAVSGSLEPGTYTLSVSTDGEAQALGTWDEASLGSFELDLQITPLSADYVAAVLVSDPLLYWSFEEAALDSAQDRITGLAGNALVPQQGATRALGMPGLGGAASFSGSRSFDQTQPRFYADALSVGGPTSFDHYAIEMWVKLNDAGGIQYLLEATGTSSTNAPALIHGFSTNGGAPALEYYGGAVRTGETGPTALNDNQWHHFVVEAGVAAATHAIYIDGALALQAPGATPWLLPSLGVGATAYWDGFHGVDGLIDELAFYDLSGGATTGARIALHYYVMFPNTTDAPDAPVPLSGPVLHANVPNPFNPSTTIRFDLPQAGQAELTIYDMAGRRVRTLVKESLDAGTHEVVWRGEDVGGRQVAAGVYLYTLRAGSHVETRRMTLLK